MSNHIDQTIADLQKEIADLEDEVVSTKRMVNRLCTKNGRPAIYAETELQTGNAGVSSIREDQFYGQPLATSVKDYLSMRRNSAMGPASVSDIHSALVKGGYEFETTNEENAKRSLRISLTKNPDFHKLPNGAYGLTAWYPKAKGSDSTHGESKGNGNGGKASSAQNAPTEEEDEEDNSEVI